MTTYIYVEFDSPQKVGSDVEMTCYWEKANVERKNITWYKLSSHGAHIPIWEFIGDGNGAEAEIPLSGFDNRIKKVEQSSYDKSHKILLTSITEEDNSTYWCEIEAGGKKRESLNTKHLHITGR